jgi:peroxiredoxin
MRLTLLAATSAFACALALAPTPARASGRDLTGSPAEEIYVQQGFNGIAPGATLASFRGRPVAMKFFFTDCPACRASLPNFERLHRLYARRGIQFLVVAYDTRHAVESYWRRNGLTLPVAIDEYGVTPARYGVTSYPTSYVIDAAGIVRSYDVVTEGVLERELSRAGVAAAPAAAAAPDPARNVAELGVVPAALAPVRDAAAKNDYGAVLRAVEPHERNAADPADVVAAAVRIAAIARARLAARIARIEVRWGSGDRKGAYEALTRVAEDFRGTASERELADRVARVRERLVALGELR